jgi:hypothetical protein
LLGMMIRVGQGSIKDLSPFSLSSRKTLKDCSRDVSCFVLAFLPIELRNRSQERALTISNSGYSEEKKQEEDF